MTVATLLTVMRTYVRMRLYTVMHPAQPHVVLYASPALPEIGAALAAQSDADELTVRHSMDGLARLLNADEQAELAAILVSRRDG